MTATLRDQLTAAQERHAAIGYFNVSDLAILKAVVKAAERLHSPVIVGASEGERKFLGTREISALIRVLREESDVLIYLNADHTHSLASAMEAAEAGFDSAVFDLSALPMRRTPSGPGKRSSGCGRSTRPSLSRARSATLGPARKSTRRRRRPAR